MKNFFKIVWFVLLLTVISGQYLTARAASCEVEPYWGYAGGSGELVYDQNTPLEVPANSTVNIRARYLNCQGEPDGKVVLLKNQSGDVGSAPDTSFAQRVFEGSPHVYTSADEVIAGSFNFTQSGYYVFTAISYNPDPAYPGSGKKVSAEQGLFSSVLHVTDATGTPPGTGGGTPGTGAGGGTGTGAGTGAGTPADCAKLQNEFNQFGGGDLTAALPKYCSTGAASTKVVNTLLLFAGSAAVLVIMFGGFRYLTSGGNAEQAKKGKLAVYWALAGLVVIFLAFALVNIITNFIVNGKLL